MLARRRCGKGYPTKRFNLHFDHTSPDIYANDNRCDVEIDEGLYDDGEFFVHPYVERQKLRIFAHLVARRDMDKQGERIVCHTSVTRCKGQVADCERENAASQHYQERGDRIV